MLNAPTKDISAEEAERLRTYLAGGGSLFLVTNYGDYSTEAMPNLTGAAGGIRHGRAGRHRH